VIIVLFVVERYNSLYSFTKVCHNTGEMQRSSILSVNLQDQDAAAKSWQCSKMQPEAKMALQGSKV